ncbi:hypothetical protein [Desulfosporosinus sp. BICA1-9]|uniref:hypothetical protein n=1 Tax=Desulfosporosinus sp. BICA1-9 TaxID=1531958 RepID=UPI00054C0ED4|nr:hypothetical protein [Desulfosporosinus sp. BICA1-9]KJS47019.1 MAG: hypothetical protein VR66_22190 [Peptococcaceae bacterium BRH_c23]KJS87846.1 MAG: hypothetical protein JL57_13275 [Desulfosporosinus sp. BICA1-9]
MLRKNRNNAKRVLFTLLLLVFIVLLAGCSDKGKGQQDVYVAYGIPAGSEELKKKIYDDPPKAICLVPIYVHWEGENKMPIEVEEITLKKGEETSFEIHLDKTDSVDKSGSSTKNIATRFIMDSNVTLTFRPPQDERVLFELSHKTTSNSHFTTTKVDGYQLQKDKPLNAEAKSNLAMVGKTDDGKPMISFYLANNGLGNLGQVACLIKWVER